MRTLAVRLLVSAALVLVALLAVRGSLSGPARWSPDGLFYQARVYEIRDGSSQDEALRRAFGGPLGAQLRVIDPTRSGNREWVSYNAQFYERRLTVPLAAAALEPIAGDRALLDVSLAGYVVAVLAIFWLLIALGLRTPIAAAAALATIFLPALTTHSSFPLTDSWGLALETAALGAAVLVMRRGPRWLIAWIAAILLLAFTRDSIWVPIIATAGVALIHRSRLSLALAGSGFAAAAVAALAVTVPLRELLGQMLNDLQPAPDLSWVDIAGRYPGAIVDLLQADGGFVRDGALYSAAFLLAGLFLLFVLARGRSGGWEATLMKAGAIAGAAYVLVVPVFSAFRLELVLVPMAAYGLGMAAERLVAHARIAGWGGSRASAPEVPGRKAGHAPEIAVGDLVSDAS